MVSKSTQVEDGDLLENMYADSDVSHESVSLLAEAKKNSFP